MARIAPDVIEEYKRQAEYRRVWVGRGHADNNLFNILVPEAICPGSVRLGSIFDGGKWVCSPSNLPEGCNIFSLGISGEVSFDTSIQTLTKMRCKIFGYEKDPNRLASDEYAKINGKSTALSVAVETNRTLNAYTISDLMKKESINSIEILKIDIEGYEFHVLLPFLEKHVVCQILIEIHGKPLDVVELLKMVSLHGYLLFHYEINPVGQLTATEFSLIHESCLKRYDAIKLSKYFSENDNIGR